MDLINRRETSAVNTTHSSTCSDSSSLSSVESLGANNGSPPADAGDQQQQKSSHRMQNVDNKRNYKSPYAPPTSVVSYDSSAFLTMLSSSSDESTNGKKLDKTKNKDNNSTVTTTDRYANGFIKKRNGSSSATTFHVANNYVMRNHLEQRHADHLYHLNLILEPNDRSALRHRFGDVKFVITGGTPTRMQSIARLCLQKLNISVPAGLTLCDLCGPHARYVMYKAGPVLAVNHGMGIPSLSIMLHEVFKLLHYAEASSDVTFFRIGTCGGVGVPAGTVVLSNKIYDGLFQTSHQQLILGKRVIRPAVLNQQLIDSLVAFASSQRYSFPVCTGATMCTDDFYEGQARLDGAICDYTSEEKLSFLQQCYALGVRNIEMESLAFVAYTHHLGAKAAVVCIALLDRLQEDQISADKTPLLEEWEQRPRKFIIDYIASQVLRTNTSGGGGISIAHTPQRHSPVSDLLAAAAGGASGNINENSMLYPPMRRSRSLAILALSPEAERAMAANAAPDDRASRMY